MRRQVITLMLLFWFPLVVSADIAYLFPNNRWFKEFDINGQKIWSEVLGPIVTKASASELPLRSQIKNYIATMAAFYGADAWFMDQLAGCESEYHPDVFNDHEPVGGTSHGLFQWQKGSWDTYNRLLKAEFDRENWRDQVKLTAQVLKKYGSGDWRNCTRYILKDNIDFSLRGE